MICISLLEGYKNIFFYVNCRRFLPLRHRTTWISSFFVSHTSKKCSSTDLTSVIRIKIIKSLLLATTFPNTESTILFVKHFGYIKFKVNLHLYVKKRKLSNLLLLSILRRKSFPTYKVWMFKIKANWKNNQSIVFKVWYDVCKM